MRGPAVERSRRAEGKAGSRSRDPARRQLPQETSGLLETRGFPTPEAEPEEMPDPPGEQRAKALGLTQGRRTPSPRERSGFEEEDDTQQRDGTSLVFPEERFQSETRCSKASKDLLGPEKRPQ